MVIESNTIHYSHNSPLYLKSMTVVPTDSNHYSIKELAISEKPFS